MCMVGYPVFSTQLGRVSGRHLAMTVMPLIFITVVGGKTVLRCYVACVKRHEANLGVRDLMCKGASQLLDVAK